jgi:hypothetical protein
MVYDSLSSIIKCLCKGLRELNNLKDIHIQPLPHIIYPDSKNNYAYYSCDTLFYQINDRENFDLMTYEGKYLTKYKFDPDILNYIKSLLYML